MGELENIDIYKRVDVALSSDFEEHYLLPNISSNEMRDLSWKALSQIFSRGVSIKYKKNKKLAFYLGEMLAQEYLERFNKTKAGVLLFVIFAITIFSIATTAFDGYQGRWANNVLNQKALEVQKQNPQNHQPL